MCISVRLKHGTEEILEDLNIKSSGLFNMRVPENVREDEEKMRAYLRGRFWRVVRLMTRKQAVIT